MALTAANKRSEFDVSDDSGLRFESRNQFPGVIDTRPFWLDSDLETYRRSWATRDEKVSEGGRLVVSTSGQSASHRRAISASLRMS
jgi:inosine/xanthosine triphosphate pyrophosphatase family protein